MFTKFWWGKPLGKPRKRWEDNFKIDLRHIGGEHGRWMEVFHAEY
jgi:hypothetical protein